MNFHSDNWAGIHPAISENLAKHASGTAAAYGNSGLDRQVERQFCELFEREVAVFFVGTGTAANSLAMTTVTRPGGVVFCHREAHMLKDECGAPEYFSGGARLHAVDGRAGKMLPEELGAALERFRPDFIHAGQPMAVSITQATEVGTVHTPLEIAALADSGKQRGLPLHMDGARFANALVHLGIPPAEMTWKQGVDMVSFGGTKNGCWCAEALVCFDPAHSREMPYLRKRAAQLFSKSRFIAAQFEAYLRDGLWLQLAAHANAAANRIAAAVRQHADCRLACSVEANEVFIILPAVLAEKWRGRGVGFYPWPVTADLAGKVPENETLIRLVTHFATTTEEVDCFCKLLDEEP